MVEEDRVRTRDMTVAFLDWIVSRGDWLIPSVLQTGPSAVADMAIIEFVKV